MIGKLKGIVDSFGADRVVIDVHGVGYVAHCSAKTLEALPRHGEAATLYIETQVRDDEIRLIGFVSEAEREWFRLMLTVQGVGSKVALSVLGTLRPQELASAIALGDKAMISRAPGVGPKVAARLCAELKDRLPTLADLDPKVVRLQAELADRSAPKPAAEAVSALVNLGYGQAQASAAVAAIIAEAGEGAATANLIRLGLKELSRS
jgi:Holliday junction DNA helicase RuvA